MAFQVNPLPVIRFQGIRLNCGWYCLEGLMRWRHGARRGRAVVNMGVPGPGRNVVYGGLRAHHTPAVKAAIRWYKIGFNVDDHKNDYGVVDLWLDTIPGHPTDWTTDPTVQTVAWWQNQLQTKGPIIAAGHLGGVRVLPFGGHYVVIVGVTNGGNLRYMDPLLGGGMMKQSIATVVNQVSNGANNIPDLWYAP